MSLPSIPMNKKNIVNLIRNIQIPNNDIKLLRYLSVIIGFEMSEISKPCYSPKVIKYKKDLMYLIGIKDSEITEFVKNLGTTYSKFDIFKDKFTVSIIIAMIKFSKTNVEISKLLFHFLGIKFYSSLMHISFPKFCSTFLWNKSLDRISSKHLFREKEGVANTINYLCDNIYNTYHVKISVQDFSDYDLIRMIYDLRHRISQSLKSLAEVYYNLQKKGTSSELGDIDEAEADNLMLLADKISITVCTYGTIDQEALSLSSEKSGIRKELCHLIINEISDVDYREELRFILILIGKAATYKYICRDSHKNTMIRRISVNNIKVGSYTVSEEIYKFLEKTKFSFRLKSYQTNQVVIFFLNYILKFIQNKICSKSNS